MTKIHLDFQGYWREPHQNKIPNSPGVFCVYAGEFYQNTQRVTPGKLLYIGESLEVRDRIASHEARERWQKHLGPGEGLLFTFAPIILGRTRSEAALIFHHQPVENREFRHSFPFDTTEVLLSGAIACLQVSFTAPDQAPELRSPLQLVPPIEPFHAASA